MNNYPVKRRITQWAAVMLAAIAFAAACTSPSPSPSPSPSGSPSPSPTGKSTGALGLPLDPWWDGGNAYYSHFPAAAAYGWSSPSFFPIAAWWEDVGTQAQADEYKTLGINTLIAGTTGDNLAAVTSDHLSMLVANPHVAQYEKSPAVVGDWLGDEEDGQFGPGYGAFDAAKNSCSNGTTGCGFTVMQKYNQDLPPFAAPVDSGGGRLRYNNYTGTVATTAPSRQPYYGFLTNVYKGRPYQDLVTSDNYWYDDAKTSSCSVYQLGQYTMSSADCPKAADYGLSVDNMRANEARSKHYMPVTSLVELSCNGSVCITPDQVMGAVMNTIVHGAGMVEYFPQFGYCNGGSDAIWGCPAGDAMHHAIATVDSQIAALAPVLNTQTLEYTFNPGVSTMLKYSGGSYYVFSTLALRSKPGSYTFTLPSGLNASTVKVLNENRTLPVSGRAFSDSFAHETSYHIYKITPGV